MTIRKKLKGRPILVTGSHRSGTTWMGKIVACHPRVRYLHEPFNVTSPNGIVGLSLDNWFTNAETSTQLSHIRDAFDSLLYDAPWTYVSKRCRLNKNDSFTCLRVIKHALIDYLYHPRLLVKDPIALMSAGWLYENYDFQVICMIRHPLAFVGSLKAAEWEFHFDDLYHQQGLLKGRLHDYANAIDTMRKEHHSFDLVSRACLLWNILHTIILQYQAQYPEWLFIKHEEIANDPVTGFNRVFNDLGLKLENRVIRKIEASSSHANPQQAAGTSYQPRNASSVVDNWKHRLDEEEVSRIIDATSEVHSRLYKQEQD